MRYQLLLSRNALNALAQQGAFAQMRDAIARRGQRVDELVFRLAEAHRRQLHSYHRRLDIASARVRAHDLRTKLAAMQNLVAAKTDALASVARNLLLRNRGRLQGLRGQLEALSPLAILERGYALVFDSKGVLIKDAALVSQGEVVRTRLAHGEFRAEVLDSKSSRTS
jgi:exodeoxyribonuclease VII large subunit